MRHTSHSPLLLLTGLLAAAVLAISCDKGNSTPEQDGPVRTLLLYSAGFNSLSTDLQADINDICRSYVPEGNGDGCDNLFFLAHHTSSTGNYSDKKPPCLIKIYRDSERHTIRDTIYTYPEGTSAIDTAVMTDVLKYIRDNYKSDEYGMIFSSHASGWLPPNFPLTGGYYTLASSDSGGQERSIGQDAGTGDEFDVKDFAKAIPMKLDYIIFDACLVGGIEVAYELKDICDYLVVSQEEILADGMVYTNISRRLLEENPTNLVGVAEDFFNHYNSMSGQYKSATVSVIDCSKLQDLAEVCSGIFANHREELDAIDPDQVQQMRYLFEYFYDFRDIITHAGIDADETEALDNALSGCIVYKANTDYFIDTELKTFSGLSMYLPTAVSSAGNRTVLDNYYKEFQWNQETGYIPE